MGLGGLPLVVYAGVHSRSVYTTDNGHRYFAHAWCIPETTCIVISHTRDNVHSTLGHVQSLNVCSIQFKLDKRALQVSKRVQKLFVCQNTVPFVSALSGIQEEISALGRFFFRLLSP